MQETGEDREQYRHDIFTVLLVEVSRIYAPVFTKRVGPGRAEDHSGQRNVFL